MDYKKINSFETRCAEAKKVFEKYPGRVPIIVERSAQSKTIPIIDKNKFLVPTDLSISQFSYVIRKRLVVPPEQAIFLFIENTSLIFHIISKNHTLPTSGTLIKELYASYKDADGFLYVKYCGENTFGF